MGVDERSPKLLTAGRLKRWAPRSKNGCETCRKRRIKCDEAKPRCYRCIRAGFKCLGYLPDSPPDAVVSIHIAPAPLCQFSASSEMRDVMLLLPEINRSAPVPSDDVCRGIRVDLELVLQELPPRNGHSVAFDTAITCTALILKEMSLQLRTSKLDIIPASQISSNISSSYSTAISALRIALSDPLHSTTIETLIAVQLLCCFESFQETHDETVVRHLFGIAKIIEHRGPQRFTTKLEKDMLLRQLPAITWSARQYNIPNFLCRKGWEAIIIPAELSGDDQSRLNLGLHRNAAYATTLLSECASLIKSSRNGKSHPVWHISLLQKVKHARHKFMKWHLRLLQDLSPIDQPSDTVSVLEQLYNRPSFQWAFNSLAACQIFCSYLLRLPVALGCDNASAIEQQTQEHARSLKKLYDKLAEEDPDFPMPCLETYAINATLSTADEWGKFAAEADDGRRFDRLKLIPEHVFKSWFDAMQVDY